MLNLLKIIYLLPLLTSCAGYKMVEKSNPLARYGIKKISVPMFLNQSTLAATSSSFTSEFISLLSSYPNLKARAGFQKDSDAVLIGIVQSNKRYSQTVINSQQRVVTTVAPNTLGNERSDFYIPATSQVKLRLKILLLLKPTEQELKLLRSKYAAKLRGNRKIIFSEVIEVTDTFNRETFDNEAGQVNFTQNYGVLNRSIKKMAKQAASTFEETILYAF
ncbi:hypothetical protein N9B72_01355 [Bacteriovoracaceae bacterium]|nr:hypothetical protein [Bacteriovoracaceae bacterium]